MDRFEQEVAERNLQQPFSEPWWQGRAFQLCARDKAIRQLRLILSADKGLGKTSTVEAIFEDPKVNRQVDGYTVVIVVTGRGMSAWERDLAKFPDHEGKIQLVRGSRVVREHCWRNPKARYFVVIHNILLEDAGLAGTKGRPSILPKWFPNGVDGLILSEFHRYIRSRKSKIFHFLKSSFSNKKHLRMVFESGSAVSRGPEDLWAALHLIDPKFWSSYWNYCYTWCEVSDTPFGKSIKGPKIDPNTGYVDEERTKRWRAAVAPYVFHVDAKDVPGEVPDFTNDPLRYELPSWQKELHDKLLRDQIAELPNGEFLFSSNRLSNLFKIRTALICPRCLSPEFGIGGGLQAIVDDIQEAELERFAIFTPFKAPIPFLEQHLVEAGFDITVLQGGIGLDEQERRLTLWREPLQGRPKGVLSTIQYAESWEIPEARYGYMLGYEYDNENNDQAGKRLRRLISPLPVYIQWAIGQGTYDEDLIQLLMHKKGGRDALLSTWNAQHRPNSVSG